VATLTPNFIPGRLLWGYLTGVVYVVAGIALLINKKERLAATSLGIFTFFAVIAFCVPYGFQHGSEIAGLNVPVDTLLMSGALLCLAGSLSEELANPAKAENVVAASRAG
jgi:uncharacterized membrane protein YphA (DoxX/SURF4 family)